MFEKIKKCKENIFVYSFLAIYIGLSLVCVITHESWADEAQAWLIARDLNVFGIINQMKYEGHSCMWHLILAPFAKLGFPYETIKFISWFFCVIAVYLILKKAPFNKFVKILLVFNPVMVYLYPAISRCYSMIPLLLACVAICYKDKEEHPYKFAISLALLANTHLIMLPLVGMILLTFWGEKLILKRKEIDKDKRIVLWKSFGIVMLGVLIYLAQATLAMFYCEIASQTESFSKIFGLKSAFSIIKNTINTTTYYMYKNILGCVIAFSIAMVILMLASFFDKKRCTYILATSLVFGVCACICLVCNQT